MDIGGMAVVGQPGHRRHGENETQTPQDSLPFAITRDQHNAIGINLEHATQRVRLAASQTILGSRSLADRYALRI
jgi:hypothetical protein